MKKLLVIPVVFFISIFSFAQYHYPSSPIVPVTDTYFGTSVTDNYRWLEDIKDPKVVSWFKAQADYTNDVINRLVN